MDVRPGGVSTFAGWVAERVIHLNRCAGGDALQVGDMQKDNHPAGTLKAIAIQVGRPLAWDPDQERFDDAEANKLLSLPPGRAPWTI